MISMDKVYLIRQLHRAGVPMTRIAQDVGVNRETVRKYVR